MKLLIANATSAFDDATFAETIGAIGLPVARAVPAVPLESSEIPPGTFFAFGGH